MRSVLEPAETGNSATGFKACVSSISASPRSSGASTSKAFRGDAGRRPQSGVDNCWRPKTISQRMLATIPPTDDERAAVDDGQAALDQLLQRLADTPTPAGPIPREIGGTVRLTV
jgi:hypothetical protein